MSGAGPEWEVPKVSPGGEDSVIVSIDYETVGGGTVI